MDVLFAFAYPSFQYSSKNNPTTNATPWKWQTTLPSMVKWTWPWRTETLKWQVNWVQLISMNCMTQNPTGHRTLENNMGPIHRWWWADGFWQFMEAACRLLLSFKAPVGPHQLQPVAFSSVPGCGPWPLTFWSRGPWPQYRVRWSQIQNMLSCHHHHHHLHHHLSSTSKSQGPVYSMDDKDANKFWDYSKLLGLSEVSTMFRSMCSGNSLQRTGQRGLKLGLALADHNAVVISYLRTVTVTVSNNKVWVRTAWPYLQEMPLHIKVAYNVIVLFWIRYIRIERNMQ